jgi:prepilin-type N-terminal cleavage/methylation domain-containing protein
MFLRNRRYLCNQGFTLIEVLITSFIATCGLVAVATMFSFAISANVNNREMAVATALLYDKMEEFKSAPLDSPVWLNGDGSDDVAQGATFTRVWEINPAIPYSVSIIVYAHSPLTHRFTELIRATASVTNTF